MIRRFASLAVICLFTLAFFAPGASAQTNAFSVEKHVCPFGQTAADQAASVCNAGNNLPSVLPPYGSITPGVQFSYAVEFFNISGVSPFTVSDDLPGGFQLSDDIECYSTSTGLSQTFAPPTLIPPNNTAAISVAAGPLEKMWCVFTGFFDVSHDDFDPIQLGNNAVTVTDSAGTQVTDGISVTVDSGGPLPVDLVVTKEIVAPNPPTTLNVPATVKYKITVTNDGGPNGDIDVFLDNIFELTDSFSVGTNSAPLNVNLAANSVTCNQSEPNDDCLNIIQHGPGFQVNGGEVTAFTGEFGGNGRLSAGQSLTLEFEVKITAAVDCYYLGDSLVNRASFSLISGDNVVTDSDGSNNQDSVTQNVDTGASIQTADCGPTPPEPKLLVTKMVDQPLTSPIDWNTPVSYSILIQNVTDEDLYNIRIRDVLINGYGNPEFASIFLSDSWLCQGPASSLSLTGGPCEIIDPPSPTQQVIASGTPVGINSPNYVQEFHNYHDAEYLWGGDYSMSGGDDEATLAVLPAGEMLHIQFDVVYNDHSCDSFDRPGPDANTITNRVAAAVDTVKLDEDGNPILDANNDPVMETSYYSASVPITMVDGEECNYLVIKDTAPAPADNLIEYGTPFQYQVVFKNDENTPREVGTVFDAVRLVDDNATTTNYPPVHFTYGYNCAPAIPGSVQSAAVPPAPPAAFAAAGLTGTAHYAAVPGTGSRIIELGPLAFDPWAKLVCKVTMTLDQPIDRPCVSIGTPQFENLALMDRSEVYGNYSDWPPSSAPYTDPPTPGLPQGEDANGDEDSWATISLELPKCYDLRLNKTVQDQFIWDGNDPTFSISVQNTADTAIEGGPGSATDTPLGYPWHGFVIEDEDVTIVGTSTINTVGPLNLTSVLSCLGTPSDCENLAGPGPLGAFDLGIGNLDHGNSGSFFTLDYPVTGTWVPGDLVCNYAQASLNVPDVGVAWYNLNNLDDSELVCAIVVPTGTLQIDKTLVVSTDHPNAPLPPLDFVFHASCTQLSSGTTTQAVDPAGTVNLPANTTTGSVDLTIPMTVASSTCQVTETQPDLSDPNVLDPNLHESHCGPNKLLSWVQVVAGTATVTPDNTTVYAVTNELTCVPKRANFFLTKSVEMIGDQITVSGLDTYDYMFAIANCGSGPLATFSPASGPHSVQGNVGETCEITETAARPSVPDFCEWADTEFELNGNSTFGSSATLTISENVSLNWLNITNRLNCTIPTSDITVQKEVYSGMMPTPPDLSNAYFDVNLNCGALQDDFHLPDSITQPGPGSIHTVHGVQLGQGCAIIEVPPEDTNPIELPDNCAWDHPQYWVDGVQTNGQFTMLLDPIEVTIVNRVICEPLPPVTTKVEINKTVINNTLEDLPPVVFGFDFSCQPQVSFPNGNSPIVEFATSLPHGAHSAHSVVPVTIDPNASANACHISETLPSIPPGVEIELCHSQGDLEWTTEITVSPNFTPNPFNTINIVANGDNVVNVVNTLECVQKTTTLTVTKTVKGGSSNDVFPVTVNCGNSYPQPSPQFDLSAAAGMSHILTNMTVGDTCTVVEGTPTLPPNCRHVPTYNPSGANTAGVQIVNGPNEVTIHNDITCTNPVNASLVLTKTVPPYLNLAQAPGIGFDVLVDCGPGGGSATVTLDASNNFAISLPSSLYPTLTPQPGQDCTISEILPPTNDPLAANAQLGWYADYPDGDQINLASGTNSLEVHNGLYQRANDGITFVKEVVIGPNMNLGNLAQMQFDINVECTVPPISGTPPTGAVINYPFTLQYPLNLSANIPHPPLNSTCTITEVQPVNNLLAPTCNWNPPNFYEGDTHVITGVGQTVHFRNSCAGTIPLPTGPRGPANPLSPVGGAAALQLNKTAPVTCEAGETCDFRIAVSNNGTAAYEGPVVIRDAAQPALGTVRNPATGEQMLRCSPSADGAAICASNPVTIPAGASMTFDLALKVPRGLRNGDTVENCANTVPLDDISLATDMHTAQFLLNALGYDAGPVDGVSGRRTFAAAAKFREEAGIPRESMRILPALRQALADWNMLDSPAGARSCATFEVTKTVRCGFGERAVNGVCQALCPGNASHWDGRQCVTCDSHSFWADGQRECVVKTDEPVTCTLPKVLNPITGQCIDLISDCPFGSIMNPLTNQCTRIIKLESQGGVD